MFINDVITKKEMKKIQWKDLKVQNTFKGKSQHTLLLINVEENIYTSEP